jgi:transcriptional regulator with XRE-family HTH domain
MDIKSLVEAAQKSAKGLDPLALGLGMHRSRLSDWKAGRRKPEASEIAYLADIAGFPILETVAEIEAQMSERHGDLWQKALKEWCAQRDSNPRPLPSEGNTLSI